MATDALKMFIVDEADVFFESQKDEKQMAELSSFFNKLKNKPQYILISATYSVEVSEKISSFVKEANQITMKKEQQNLQNIQQFYFKTDYRKKIDFVKEIFDICQG